jgi:hypothetical protein
VARPARELHAVGGVEDHRIPPLTHDGKTAEVGDQVVIAEARPSLRQQQAVVPGGHGLVHDVFHIPWSEELPLLDVHHLAGPGRRDHQIGLPAQERRDLQHIQHLRGGMHVFDGVNIREHGHADLLADLFEDAEAFLHPEPAERRPRGPVRLVVGRLKDVRNV